MTDLHIDDFYKDCARILLQLYRNFPRKCVLYVEDISGPDIPDEYGLHSDRHLSCLSAGLWLAESGYLTYAETIRQEALDQVVLSHKGFTLLSAPAVTPSVQPRATPNKEQQADLPTSVLETTQSNIFKLRQSVKSGSSTQLRHMLLQLFKQSQQHP